MVDIVDVGVGYSRLLECVVFKIEITMFRTTCGIIFFIVWVCTIVWFMIGIIHICMVSVNVENVDVLYF